MYVLLVDRLKLFSDAPVVTFFSILTTIVLFKGLSAPAMQIITLVMGFLVICVGITILQLSKIDPTQLKVPGLDRRSTMLLQAARSNTAGVDEKSVAAVEDPASTPCAAASARWAASSAHAAPGA